MVRNTIYTRKGAEHLFHLIDANHTGISIYMKKKGTPKSSLPLYQPIDGACNATSVVEAAARSRGKL